MGRTDKQQGRSTKHEYLPGRMLKHGNAHSNLG